jgi:hypothetical protein
MKCASPVTSTYTPAKSHALQHLLAADGDIDTHNYVPHSDHETSQTWHEQPYQVEPDLMDMHCATELDFQLIWPDSEELFQSIMSTDTTSHMPVGTLPFPQGIERFTPTSLDSPTSVDDRGSAIKAIPNGGGHQAVYGVSKMISNLVRGSHRVKHLLADFPSHQASLQKPRLHLSPLCSWTNASTCSLSVSHLHFPSCIARHLCFENVLILYS